MMNKLDFKECEQYAKTLPGAEHTHLRSLDELSLSEDCISLEYGKTDKNTGVLLSTKRNEKGELISYYTRKKLGHVTVIGSSGSGKSEGDIRGTLMNQNGSQSGVYTDVKGELMPSTYYRLCEIYGKENVKTINFMEPEKSDYHVNYLYVLADEWRTAYRSKMTVEEKRLAWGRVVSELKKYMDILFVVTSQKDPTWETVGKNFILAIVIGLFEDLTLTKEEERKTKRCRTTPEIINFSTVYQIFHSFSWGKRYRNFEDGGFLTNRESSSLAFQYSNAVINNAENTRANYLQFVDNYLKEINDPRIKAISAFNDFNVEELGKKPQILFIIYDISDVCLREYVNKVVAQNINLLLESTHKKAKPLDVPVVFYLDEFPTLRPNPVYPNILATGRGSNIFLHMVIQSYSQLESRYPEEYKAMLENCDFTYFIGTNDADTAKKFATELGQTTIPNPVDYLHGHFSTITVPVVSQDYLMHRMQDGEVFIKMHRRQPIRGFFEFHHRTKEYQAYPLFENQGIKVNRPLSVYDAPWLHSDEDDDDDLF